MAQHDRRRLYSLLAIYGALALAWLAFAGWVVPPLLTAKQPGTDILVVKRYLDGFVSAFLPRDTLDRWRLFTQAVLIALMLHLTIVMILRWYDRPPSGGSRQRRFEPHGERVAGWRSSRWCFSPSPWSLGQSTIIIII